MKEGRPLDWEMFRKDVDDVERSIPDWDEGLRGTRARFLLSAKGQSLRAKPKRSFRAAWASLAVAATIALGFAGFARYQRSLPVSFDTGTERAAGHVGALLASRGSESLPVHFSDGTSFSMAAATVARVTETNAHGATVVLEDGSLGVAVVHHDASRWHVAAGPFTVIVTGTKFDVRWSNPEQTLALDLHEGSVTVLGPSLGPTGRRVMPGESLRVSVAEARAGAPPPAPEAPGETAVAPATRDDGAKTASGDTSALGHGAWKQLALEARYAEALAAAEAEGFETVCRRASAADLLLLGDTARFAGSPKRAEQALQLARARPGGKHEAAMSAFTLGRIAYDERQRYREAARWFQSYLREEPAGGLAREASGRLIEAERAAGDVAAARESAATYLSKYPAGPHAALARSVLNR